MTEGRYEIVWTSNNGKRSGSAGRFSTLAEANTEKRRLNRLRSWERGYIVVDHEAEPIDFDLNR